MIYQKIPKHIIISIFTVTKELKPCQSFRQEPKKIRCVETGEIFKNAKEVNELLIQQGKSTSYSAFSRIKDVCNKKKKKHTDTTGNSSMIKKKKLFPDGFYVKIRLWI